VPCYEYTGIIIQKNGNIHQEITNRTNIVYDKVYQLNQNIFGKKEIFPNTKIQI
jgi:hypothetical protein